MKQPIQLSEKQVDKKLHEPREKELISQENSISTGFLNAVILWLREIINQRCAEIASDTISQAVYSIKPLPSPEEDSPYAQISAKYNLDETGHVLLALAVAPHYFPEVFERILLTRDEKGYLKPHFGGQYDQKSNQFIPTYFTALFLLSGNNLTLRGKYVAAIQDAHPLLQQQILYQGQMQDVEKQLMHSVIELDSSFYDYFTKGVQPRLDHGQHFAATLHESKLTKDDVILEETVAAQIQPIDKYAQIIDSDFFNSTTHKFKKGFIALFYGSPGTGKTLLASILANSYGLDMYHVDLSNVVSRYVGEAEKKLEIIFNRLQGKNCMLFFDEADALFGKRSEVKEAHDRYANQEVSYLLQRIEKFDGLVVLASNFKNNMDDAFLRRMDVTVNVIRPKEKSREALWKHYLPSNLEFESDQLLAYLVKEFAYTGANIRNVMKNVAIAMASENKTIITYDDMIPYLKIENDKAFGPQQGRIRPMGVTNNAINRTN